jgi:hypothetical protein
MARFINSRELSDCFLGQAQEIENPRVGGSIPSPATIRSETRTRACSDAGPSSFQPFIKFRRKFAAWKALIPARGSATRESLALFDPAFDPAHALVDGSARCGQDAIAPLDHAGEPATLRRHVADAAFVPIKVRAIGTTDPVAGARQGSSGRNAHSVIVVRDVAVGATACRQGARHEEKEWLAPHEEGVGEGEARGAASRGSPDPGQARAGRRLARRPREDARARGGAARSPAVRADRHGGVIPAAPASLRGARAVDDLRQWPVRALPVDPLCPVLPLMGIGEVCDGDQGFPTDGRLERR